MYEVTVPLQVHAGEHECYKPRMLVVNSCGCEGANTQIPPRPRRKGGVLHADRDRLLQDNRRGGRKKKISC